VSEIFGRVGGPRDGEADPVIEAMVLKPDPRGARWFRRHLAAGVVALTTRVDAAFRATTLSACFVASIDPPQFLASIDLDSQMDDWLQEAGIFALNLLPWDQQVFADRFAGLAPLASSRFSEVDHFLAATGAPILRLAIGWADCRIIQTFETGDHRCFVGQAEALGRGDGVEDDPLVYFLNRYRRIR
jgi:flavin reductase (DIM6/NTAB) family NADH-FMN oxidoreductase RutF